MQQLQENWNQDVRIQWSRTGKWDSQTHHWQQLSMWNWTSGTVPLESMELKCNWNPTSEQTEHRRMKDQPHAANGMENLVLKCPDKGIVHNPGVSVPRDVIDRTPDKESIESIIWVCVAFKARLLTAKLDCGGFLNCCKTSNFQQIGCLKNGTKAELVTLFIDGTLHAENGL